MKGKGIYFSVSVLLGVFCALLDVMIFFMLFLLYVYLLSKFKSFSKKQISLIIFMFFLFWMVGIIANGRNVSILTGNENEFNFIFQEWKINGDQLQITVKDEKSNEKLLLQYDIKSESEKNQLETRMKFGSNCTVSGKLTTPSTASNPNAFDYQRYLATKGIYWIITTDHNPMNSCSAPTFSYLSFIGNLRQTGIKYLLHHFPEPLASLSAALIFGERTEMSPQLVTSYQKIGIVHLLAISGLQVSFFTGLLFFIGIRIGVIRETMLNILIIFLPFYAILTGASPSIVRAVLMMLLIFISLRLTKERFQPLDAWSGALILSLAYSPFLIYDVGFQLSFTATLSLLLSTMLLANFKHPASQILMTTVIASIATLPILLFYFYEFASISLLANFIFVPFFSIFLSPITFFIFILHPILGSLLNPVISFINWTIVFANKIIEWFSGLPFLMITPGRPALILLCVYIILVFFTFFKMEKAAGKINVATFCLLLPLLLQFGMNTWSPTGEITFIDVGQGDAVLIVLPFHQGTYLLDTGGMVPFATENWQQKSREFEIGKDIVVPFLKSKGITRINKLILSHGDYDHIGGAQTILNELKVEEIVLPQGAEQSKLEKGICQIAKSKGIITTYVSEGSHWKSGENEFQVLSPPSQGIKLDKNNASIVIYARIGGLTWLFTGDMEKEREVSLAENYSFLDIEVLKVGHHGSKTSTSEELLEEFTPEMAIISVGEKNRYGHPHQEVIKRLEQKHIQILRTDQQGAISYFFRGRNGTFSTWTP